MSEKHIKNTSENYIKNAVDCEEILGFQVRCASCDVVFYDLKQLDPTCPKCSQHISKTHTSRRVVYEQEEQFEDTSKDNEHELDEMFSGEDLFDLQ